MSANEVFEARNEAELAARYDEWAASYESDMGDHGGPAESVQALAQYVAPAARILERARLSAVRRRNQQREAIASTRWGDSD